MKRAILFVMAMLLSGCAINSGIVPIGKDTFMVSRQAATGFVGSRGLKDDALQEANQFCVNQGKVLKVINIGGNHPPYILGNFPKVKIQFMCLDANDPRLKQEDFGTIQQPTQDMKIEEDNNPTLETKLKTLNKLLVDRLITKNEFDEQKKKLLDDYTSKKD